MRLGPSLVLLAACATPTASRPPEVDVLLRRAADAVAAPDWPAARGALEEAAHLAPADLDVNLRLAETLLKAYGEIDAARRLYWRVRHTSRARALHGLGLCALWEADEERALQLFEASLAERPTAACARDLAVRRLARGTDAGEALAQVEKTSGNTVRSGLLLAAAGRRPRPATLPEGWTYGLERARLAPLAEAPAEVSRYVSAACATPRARQLMEAVLEGDFALQRNPGPRREVKD
ncbi:MAG: tetratricopeptide repeat protein [Planctomycetota bacterium]|jgi:Tfp pilus assembly protein PilF